LLSIVFGELKIYKRLLKKQWM